MNQGGILHHDGWKRKASDWGPEYSYLLLLEAIHNHICYQQNPAVMNMISQEHD